MRPLLVLAVLGLLAAVSVGCGDGDETSTGPAEPTTATEDPLTRADLTDQASEICAGLTTSLTSLGTPPNLDPETLTPESIRATSDFWDQSADAGEDAVAELSQLQAPQSIAKRWDRFLALYERGMVEYQRALADAAESGDKSKFFTAAFRGQTTLRQLNAVAASLGLDACQTASASG
jgi:HEAT repeat protein